MICGHDLTSLIGVDVIDTSLGSAGAMMQKTLCQTMQICITIKKNEVALETAETAPSAQCIAYVWSSWAQVASRAAPAIYQGRHPGWGPPASVSTASCTL